MDYEEKLQEISDRFDRINNSFVRVLDELEVHKHMLRDLYKQNKRLFDRLKKKQSK